jgi:hypothetical protein
MGKNRTRPNARCALKVPVQFDSFSDGHRRPLGTAPVLVNDVKLTFR